MRLSVLISAFALGVGSAFAAEPAGTYNVLDLESARACAQACDEDSLCVAWSFGAPSNCSLSAVAPRGETDSKTLISGLSVNAPAFVRREAAAAPAALEPAPASNEASATQQSAAQASSLAMDDTHSESMLLGGPDEGTLRPQLN